MRDAALNLTMSLETKAAAGLDGRMKATRQDTIQAASLAILAVLAVGWFLNAAQAVILPIILGLLVASLLDAVSRLFKQVPALDRLMPDGLRVGIAAIVLFVVLVVGVGFFARNLDPVVRAIPQYIDALSDVISGIAGRFDYEIEITWQSFERLLLDTIDIQSAIRYTLNSVSFSAGYLAVVFLYAVLFLLEKRSFAPKVAAVFTDEASHANVWATIHSITDQIGTYFTTKTLINVVLGILCYAIFMLFGLEFAAFFAVLTAVFNYIPYVGSWIAAALPVLFAFGQFGWSPTVLALLVAILGVQMAIGYFWEPRIMGRNLNLSPVVILISLAAWTALWGLTGAILSVILTSAIVTILLQFKVTRPVAIFMSHESALENSAATRSSDQAD